MIIRLENRVQSWMMVNDSPRFVQCLHKRGHVLLSILILIICIIIISIVIISIVIASLISSIPLACNILSLLSVLDIILVILIYNLESRQLTLESSNPVLARLIQVLSN